MIEDIFLEYANNSLKEDPANLYKIFSTIQKNIEIDLEGIDEAIKIICDLSNKTSKNILLRIKEKISESGWGPYERNVYHAITGSRLSYITLAGAEATKKCIKKYIEKLERYEKEDKERLEIFKERDKEVIKIEKKTLERYEKEDKDMLEIFEKKDKEGLEVLVKNERLKFNCGLREINKRLLGEDRCEEFFELKCYECHQLRFIDFLNDIVVGKEYSKIEGIEDILYSSSVISPHELVRSIQSMNQKTPFKEKLQVKKQYTYGYHDYMRGSIYGDIRGMLGNCYHAFNEYLSSIAYFSVTEFLISNDRRKIKKCPFCNRFFIARDIKRKRCYSEGCDKAYEREKKQKQRANDPVKYC